MTDRELMQQIIDAWDQPGGINYYDFKPYMDQLRERLARQEPVQCEPQPAVTDDGFCDWVCPNPESYLMQCCDCGLIHEVQTRVAKYEPRPSENYDVVADPDTQAQWRMRRRDDLSPARQEQEPMTWKDMAYASLGAIRDKIGSEDVAVVQRFLDGDYTAPPTRQWQGLTEGEIEASLGPFPKYASEWDDSDFHRYAHAIEAKLREKNG